jgi:hypothetical protein
MPLADLFTARVKYDAVRIGLCFAALSAGIAFIIAPKSALADKPADSAVLSSLRLPTFATANSGIISPACVSNPVVTNTNDNGAGSLRDAILNACVGDTITFSIPMSDPGFSAGVYTITLASELVIGNGLTISGPGAGVLTISGNDRWRVLNINAASPSVITLTGFTVAHGSVSDDRGGGIRNSGTATVNISNLKVVNNSSFANVGGAGGAGIYNQSTGTININNSTVDLNHAGPHTSGGGILSAGGTVNVVNSTISNNTAQGISVSGAANINFINSTLSLNGDGIFTVGSGVINVTNATIISGAGNNGLVNFGSGQVRVRNSIVSHNTSSPTNADLNGPFVSQGHNLISAIDGLSTGFTAGPNNPNGDLVGTTGAPLNPLLGSLQQSNSASTFVMPVLPGSPAIDAGDNCVADAAHCGDPGFNQITTDQRGVARVVNGTVDMGAYESRPFHLSIVSGSSQSATIGTNFGQPLSLNVASDFNDQVNGGFVTFTPPASGPGGSFPPTSLQGKAVVGPLGEVNSPTFTANGIAGGPYSVTAATAGGTNVVSFNLTNTKATPAMTLTTSVNPSDFSESVTFTATCRAGSLVPPEPVQFVIDSTTTSVALDGNGVAQLTTSTLSPGNHDVRVDYAGDANFNANSAQFSAGIQIVSPPPSLSIDDHGTLEGNSGTFPLTFTVTLNSVRATHLTTQVDYATADGTATAPSDYVAVPKATLTFSPGQTSKQITVLVNGDQTFEPDETFTVNLSNPVNASISKAQGTGSIANDDPRGGLISLSSSNYNVSESAGFTNITVNRSGETFAPVTVDYTTTDAGAPSACGTTNGLASSRCDFITAKGTLNFAAGETQKTFVILINRDSYAEGPEIFSVNLSNPTGGAALASPSSAGITITDDNSGLPPNAIDDTAVFVRQHYHDFLNREADANGLAFWTDQINSCGADAQCREVRRINVSASFFLSIEFQDTGYLVERIYKASYGDVLGNSNLNGIHQVPVPIVRLNEFLPDTQQISQEVVVLQPGWEQVLENNKVAFVTAFVQRSRFVSAYPTFMTPAEFVDKLFLNTGVPPSASDRAAAINEFGGATNTTDVAARGRALRRVAENSTLITSEFNRAFVLMQYFGYLRRNPNDSPDSDYSGYDSWLTKLNQFNGNYINAEMVKAFIGSGEYRQRFGP